jgi:hypothetical protein
MNLNFDRYTVRPVDEKDRPYIDRLTFNDPYHHGVMDADWFLNLAPGEGAWAIEDEQGRVVLYFKTQNAVRLSVQFGEQNSTVNRDVLTKGMEWLEGLLLQNHFREVIFDTDGPALKAMAKRRLGFRDMGKGTLTRPLLWRRLVGHWQHQPTAFEKAG